MSPISVVVFHRCYINGIMQFISSAIGFFPISTVSLRFSQVVPCISSWLLFVAEWCSLIGMHYSLTTHPLKYICITPFSGEKTEVQKGIVTCPGLHSWWEAQLGFEFTSVCLQGSRSFICNLCFQNPKRPIRHHNFISVGVARYRNLFFTVEGTSPHANAYWTSKNLMEVVDP